MNRKEKSDRVTRELETSERFGQPLLLRRWRRPKIR
jgi:hypothetical protein